MALLLPGFHGIEFRTSEQRTRKLIQDNFGPEIVLFEQARDLLHFSRAKYVNWVVWTPVDPGPWPNERIAGKRTRKLHVSAQELLGFVNLGNTCWVAAPLQAVLRLVDVHDSLSDLMRRIICHVKNPEEPFYFTQLLEHKQVQSLLKDAGGPGQMQDAQAFLTLLTTTLIDENASSNLFRCEVRQVFECQTCKRRAAKAQVHSVLSLPMKTDNQATLVSTLLDNYFDRAELIADTECGTGTAWHTRFRLCGRKTMHKVTLTLSVCPRVLCLHLNRRNGFSDPSETARSSAPVTIEKVIKVGGIEYKLHSAILHTTDPSHYITVVNDGGDVWKLCDDRVLTTIDIDEYLDLGSTKTDVYCVVYTMQPKTDTNLICLQRHQLCQAQHTRRAGGNLWDKLPIKNMVALPRRDLQCLHDGEWLNDECINQWLYDIQRHATIGKPVYIFKTQFYKRAFDDDAERTFEYASVKRWLKKVDDIFSHKIIVPINQGLHWVVVVIDIQDRRMDYFDSLCQGDEARQECMNLQTWLCAVPSPLNISVAPRLPL
jgi:hypothetical protein